MILRNPIGSEKCHFGPKCCGNECHKGGGKGEGRDRGQAKKEVRGVIEGGEQGMKEGNVKEIGSWRETRISSLLYPSKVPVV